MDTTLYKYLHKKYAESLINEGEIRIGTLYNFRKSELHGTEIGDDGEGTIVPFFEAEADINKLEEFPDFVKNGLGLSGENLTVTAKKGFKLKIRKTLPDLYILCFSIAKNDPEIFSKSEYDTCVEINNVNEFIECISDEIKDKAEYIGTDKCVYSEREVQHIIAKIPHPILLKPIVYEYW
jgi:hypothetical protein